MLCKNSSWGLFSCDENFLSFSASILFPIGGCFFFFFLSFGGRISSDTRGTGLLVEPSVLLGLHDARYILFQLSHILYSCCFFCFLLGHNWWCFWATHSVFWGHIWHFQGIRQYLEFNWVTCIQLNMLKAIELFPCPCGYRCVHTFGGVIVVVVEGEAMPCCARGHRGFSCWSVANSPVVPC